MQLFNHVRYFHKAFSESFEAEAGAPITQDHLESLARMSDDGGPPTGADTGAGAAAGVAPRHRPAQVLGGGDSEDAPATRRRGPWRPPPERRFEDDGGGWDNGDWGGPNGGGLQWEGAGRMNVGGLGGFGDGDDMY